MNQRDEGSAADAGTHGHDFQRDRASHNCSLCMETWPSSDGVVSKYYVCSLCGKITNDCELLEVFNVSVYTTENFLHNSQALIMLCVY
jgi:hypothetical protein